MVEGVGVFVSARMEEIGRPWIDFLLINSPPKTSVIPAGGGDLVLLYILVTKELENAS